MSYTCCVTLEAVTDPLPGDSMKLSFLCYVAGESEKGVYRFTIIRPRSVDLLSFVFKQEYSEVPFDLDRPSSVLGSDRRRYSAMIYTAGQWRQEYRLKSMHSGSGRVSQHHVTLLSLWIKYRSVGSKMSSVCKIVLFSRHKLWESIFSTPF